MIYVYVIRKADAGILMRSIWSVHRFVECAGCNHLRLNINKTKDMMILHSGRSTMGVNINNRLDWKPNTEAVYKKEMGRLLSELELRSSNVCNKMLDNFNQAVMWAAYFSLPWFVGEAALQPVTTTFHQMLKGKRRSFSSRPLQLHLANTLSLHICLKILKSLIFFSNI